MKFTADNLQKLFAQDNPGSIHAAVYDNGVSGGKSGANVTVGPRNLYDGVVAARRNAKRKR